MKLRKAARLPFLFACSALLPGTAWAELAVSYGASEVRDTGVSGIWVLANISYAGMRAQANPSKGWRIVAFIFGFPGTVVSYFAVREGSGQAYGVDLPARSARASRQHAV